MLRILLDTNIIVDYLMGREPGCTDCNELLVRRAQEEIAVYVSALSLKDVYYLVSMHLKRMERQASGILSDSKARAANEIAWSCVRALLEDVLVVPTGHSDCLQAVTYKPVHPDFEDDLVIAAARRAEIDYVVSNDESLIRHAPAACLSSADVLALLNAEVKR